MTQSGNAVLSKRRVQQQQMCWGQRGTPWLLPIRTRVLNSAWDDGFRRGYPGCRADPISEAA
jgi:hypothetical protein